MHTTIAQVQATTPIPMHAAQPSAPAARNPTASKQVEQLGWKYYYQGDLDTASKRFKQARTLDAKNAGAYWGWGLIIGQSASEEDTQLRLSESIRFLAKARDLDPKNGRIVGDLAYANAEMGRFLDAEKMDASKHYVEADNLFRQAYELNPQYPPLLANWSLLKFYVGDYSTAKLLLAVATNLGFTPDPAYVLELAGKMN